MTILWGKDSQVFCGAEKVSNPLGSLNSPAMLAKAGRDYGSDEQGCRRIAAQPAGKPSGLSSRLRLAAQCENGAGRDPERLISPEKLSTNSQRCSPDLTVPIRPSLRSEQELPQSIAGIAGDGNREGSAGTAPMPVEIGQTRARRGSSVEAGTNFPRVYSAWIDDFSDDLYQFAGPGYTHKSTFNERVAEIALCGFILLALIGLLAGKI